LGREIADLHRSTDSATLYRKAITMGKHPVDWIGLRPANHQTQSYFQIDSIKIKAWLIKNVKALNKIFMSSVSPTDQDLSNDTTFSQF